jgi:mono/diheme cytochrome c family protein
MRAFAIAWTCVCLVFCLTPMASAAEDGAELAARLEHKLAYLAADYALAASSRAASDEGESTEHVQLAEELERSVAQLGLPPEEAKRVTAVSALVRRSASASEVGGAVVEARRTLIASLHIPTSPTATPDRAHGQALFEQLCATCHGLIGRADTERAAFLRPHPANFLDPNIGEPLSPYRISTTIRFGVDGTPMVPLGFLSEVDRWDVAFYVMGLRHVARPAEDGPVFPIVELAIRSDAELRADLRAAGVREALVEPTLSDLRRRAPYVSAVGDAWPVARYILTALGLLYAPRFSRTGLVGRSAAVFAMTFARAFAHAGTAEPGTAEPGKTASVDEPVEARQTEDRMSRPVETDRAAGTGVPSSAPCSSPGYGPGPEPRAEKGMPPFVTIFNCLWPSHARMETSVSLTRPAKRAEVAGLLRALWSGLKSKMGKDFPETAKVCVLARGATVADAPLGCIKDGYEPEGEPGEEDADLRVDMPPEPVEVADALQAALGKRFKGTHRPRVAVEPSRSELTVLYPYVEEGADASGAQPSYVDVLLPFMIAAWDFYPPKSDASDLAFQGVWNDKTLLTARVPDVSTFLAMQPWAVRQRLEEAHIPLTPGARRSDEQNAVLRRELEGALARLPRGSVSLDSTLR